MDAILDISKCSMMPEWYHSDFSRTMYTLPESTKKKNFKIKFQVLLKFTQILPDYALSMAYRCNQWQSRVDQNISPYTVNLIHHLSVFGSKTMAVLHIKLKGMIFYPHTITNDFSTLHWPLVREQGTNYQLVSIINWISNSRELRLTLLADKNKALIDLKTVEAATSF